MKSLLSIDDWVKKSGNSYDYQFKVNFELIVDMPGITITDDDYTSITGALKVINDTIAPYRKIAVDRIEKEDKK